MLSESRLGNVSRVEESQPSFRYGYQTRCQDGCDVILSSTDDISKHYNLMDHNGIKPVVRKRPRAKKQVVSSN